ncbi:MAG: hypothetical protein ACE5I7_07120 [Candidatus Binatia bacterium]
MMKRRDFLRGVGSAVSLAGLGRFLPACGSSDRSLPVNEAGIQHILPTVSADRLLLKVSFADSQPIPPVLRADWRRVQGLATDTDRRFWAFDVPDLEPARRYTLQIRTADFRSDPWSIRTLPARDARPEHLRLLMYTCAGGNDIFRLYVPTPVRRRLLRRALALEPDAVVANGDQVYWDLRAGVSALVTGKSRRGIAVAGVFDRAAPVLGHENENVLKRAVGAQIAGLYGTMFRSIPVFFLRDDHDYFEDDQVTPELTTFPADDFMVRLARATQWLYYPEFLPDPDRPLDLPAATAPDRPPGVSEAFGTLRYGQLLEALLYDCKGFLTLAGERGTLIPSAVERWVLQRLGDPGPDHVMQVPSNPPGWTAGKFAEWYPDVLGPDRTLTTDIPKPGWQPGWLAQHDRLLAAAAAAPDRVPLIVSGDIHSIAEGLIVRSGMHDFRVHPVVALITGTPGTGAGWPSAARGTLATPPAHIELEPVVPVQEYNGFDLLDFEPARVTVRTYRWRKGVDSEEAIDTLEPLHVSVYRRA